MDPIQNLMDLSGIGLDQNEVSIITEHHYYEK